MADAYEPIRTALGECFAGDTSLMKAVFSTPATMDQRLIALLTGLGLGVDTPAATAITTADIKAFLASLHATDNAQRITKIASLFVEQTAQLERLRREEIRSRNWNLRLEAGVNASGSPLDITCIGSFQSVGPAESTYGFPFFEPDIGDMCKAYFASNNSVVDGSTPLYTDTLLYKAFADATALVAGYSTYLRGPRVYVRPSLRSIQLFSPSNSNMCFTIIPFSSVTGSTDLPDTDIEFEVSYIDGSQVPRSVYVYLYDEGGNKGIGFNLTNSLINGSNPYRPVYMFRMRRESVLTTEWKVDACISRLNRV